MRKLLAFIISLALASITYAGAAQAKGLRTIHGEPSWCGTRPDLIFDLLRRHEENSARLKAKGLAPLLTQDRDIGHIAVIEDDGSIVTEANPFDLNGRSIRFTLRDGAYDIAFSDTAFDTNLGNKLSLDDDDSREVDLGFSFPFFGQIFDRVFVNTDGNLTFIAGDSESTARDLRRFSSGPPRIAVLFLDLNPADSGTPSDGGVFSNIQAGKATFTWNKVPVFRDRATDPLRLNTFQVTLSSNGQIEFIYSSVNVREAIVGISPGGAAPANVNRVKFVRALPLSGATGAIAERFVQQADVDLVALAKKFYRSHPDAFDFLIVFTNFPIDLGGAFAFNAPISNNVRGIGFRHLFDRDVFDFSRVLGSNGRLQSLVMMNQLDEFPDVITDNIPGLGTNNTLDILAQEAGHRWGAYVRFNDNGRESDELLGRDRAHWSFFMDTDASELEGNDIRDNGDGTFTTIEATERYSPLDQYLMGLRAASEVQPFFFVSNPTDTNFTRESPPRRNVTFRGTRRNVTIDEIIAVEGPRIPDVNSAPKTFTGAFILLVKQGAQPSQAEIEKMERIRKGWVEFFPKATDGRGTFIATITGEPEVGTPVTINFSRLAGGGGEFTGYAIANRSRSIPADITFTAFDNNGQQLNLPGMRNPSLVQLPPRQQLARIGPEIFGLPADSVVNGWIEARSSSDALASFLLIGRFDQTILDGVTAAPETFTDFVLPRVIEGTVLGQDTTTEINLINPSGSVASVQIRLFAADGSAQGSVSRTIPPRGRLVETVRRLFPNLAPSSSLLSGHLEITSSQGLQGFELIRYGNTAISALQALKPSRTVNLFSPHFVSGGRGLLAKPFFTSLNLVNTTGSAINVKVTLVDNEGRAIQAAGVTNPIERTIAPKAHFAGTAELFGLPSGANDPELRIGSLIIEASAQGLVGDVLFGDASNAAVMSNLPLTTDLATSGIFSQIAEGNVAGVNFFTGIAVLNPNGRAVDFSISAFAPDGRQIGSTRTMTMPPRSRFSQTLSQLIPEASGQVGGYVTFETKGGGVAAFEIFGDADLARFNAAVTPTVIATEELKGSVPPRIERFTVNPLDSDRIEIAIRIIDPDGDVVRIGLEFFAGSNRVASSEIKSPDDVDLRGLTDFTLRGQLRGLRGTGANEARAKAIDSAGNESETARATFQLPP